MIEKFFIVVCIVFLLPSCHRSDVPPPSRFGFARVSLTLYDWEHESPLRKDPVPHFHTSWSGATGYMIIKRHVEVDSMGRCYFAETKGIGEPLVYFQTTLPQEMDSIFQGIEGWQLERFHPQDRSNYSHPWRAIIVERKDGSHSMAIGDWLSSPADLPPQFLRLDSLLRDMKGDTLPADSMPPFEFQALADSIGKRQAERESKSF